MEGDVLLHAPAMGHLSIQEEEVGNGSLRNHMHVPIAGSVRQELINLTNIEKLIRYNFAVWKFQMKIMLRARKLLGIVERSIPRESFNDEDDWINKDAGCQSLLISIVDPKLMRRLVTSRTTNQMWRRLCTVHE